MGRKLFANAIRHTLGVEAEFLMQQRYLALADETIGNAERQHRRNLRGRIGRKRNQEFPHLFRLRSRPLRPWPPTSIPSAAVRTAFSSNGLIQRISTTRTPKCLRRLRCRMRLRPPETMRPNARIATSLAFARQRATAPTQEPAGFRATPCRVPRRAGSAK